MSARESIIPVFVPHLGCPNDCVFCNQRRITGSERPATAQTVAEAIERASALPCGGAKRQLAFYGGSFSAIPACEQEELLCAAQRYLERGEIDSIRLSTRPDAIDGATLRRLREHGVETIELGAQSLDDEVLRLSGRGHTARDVVDASEAIKAAREADIPLFCYEGGGEPLREVLRGERPGTVSVVIGPEGGFSPEEAAEAAETAE